MATNVERQKTYVDRLKESGGKRVTMDFTASTIEAIEAIKKRDGFKSSSQVVFAALRQMVRRK